MMMAKASVKEIGFALAQKNKSTIFLRLINENKLNVFNVMIYSKNVALCCVYCF